MKLLILVFGKPALAFIGGLIGFGVARQSSVELEVIPAPELERIEIDEDKILGNPDFHKGRIPPAPGEPALPGGFPVPDSE